MRRALFPILMALLVVCAQQASLVHAIAHGAGHATGAAAPAGGAAQPGPAEDGSSGNAGYCDKCFQFAHVAGATFASAPAQFFLASAPERASARTAAEIGADAPPSRSRDPPIVL